jgi:hypothetical protein
MWTKLGNSIGISVNPIGGLAVGPFSGSTTANPFVSFGNEENLDKQSIPNMNSLNTNSIFNPSTTLKPFISFGDDQQNVPAERLTSRKPNLSTPSKSLNIIENLEPILGTFVDFGDKLLPTNIRGRDEEQERQSINQNENRIKEPNQLPRNVKHKQITPKPRIRPNTKSRQKVSEKENILKQSNELESIPKAKNTEFK